MEFPIDADMAGKIKEDVGDFTNQKSSQQTRLRKRNSYENSSFTEDLFNHFESSKHENSAFIIIFVSVNK